jgi:hypothetical protein
MALKNSLFSCALILALAAAPASPVLAEDAAAVSASSAAADPEGVLKHFGFVAKVSSMGVGGDVGVSFTRLANVRVGFNALDFSQGFRSNGIQYNGTLHFRSAEALLDLTPLGDWFHISPGLLFYNGNQITAKANVPGGQNFDLGSVSFRSSPTDPIHGTGLLTVNKAAPMVLFGFGNPIPHHHHITIVQEFGVVFQGTPKTTLSLAGTACDPVTGLACVNAATDPTVQAQIQSEQARINKDTSIVKFYPVATLGIGFRF